MEIITWRSWYMILIPDTVIDQGNLLGKNQPEILLLTDCKGRLIIYGDFEITGVDRYEQKAPLLQIDNENDNLDNQEDKEEVHTKEEKKPSKNQSNWNWNS